MLPLESDTLVDNCSTQYMIDQLIDNECFCTNNNQNSQPMTSNEFANKTIIRNNTKTTVNKSYELNNNIIQESYFTTEGMENANEFVSDYAKEYPNGVILVMNKVNRNKETEIFSTQLHTKLKHIITCGTDNNSNYIDVQQSHSETFESAVQTAYKMATNGQAILFQGVSKNFDLFSYIY